MDTSDSKLHDKIDKVDSNLGGKILDVSCDLERLKRRVTDNEKGLDIRIETVVNRITGGVAPPRHPTGVRPRPTSRPTERPDEGQSSYKEERYWRARQSLRIWR